MHKIKMLLPMLGLVPALLAQNPSSSPYTFIPRAVF